MICQNFVFARAVYSDIIIKSSDPLRAKKTFIRKKLGRGFGYLSLIRDPINLAKGARGKYCVFASFNKGSHLKD